MGVLNVWHKSMYSNHWVILPIIIVFSQLTSPSKGFDVARFLACVWSTRSLLLFEPFPSDPAKDSIVGWICPLDGSEKTV